MRSYLTRRVFTRILSNEPYHFRCYRPVFRATNNVSLSIPRKRQISLFGYDFKGPRQPRGPQVPPGLDKIAVFIHGKNVHIRLSPANELADAFRSFVKYKHAHAEALSYKEATFLLATFRHLQKAMADEGDSKVPWALTPDDYILALKALHIMPKESREAHNEIARDIHGAKSQDLNPRISQHMTFLYMRLMTMTGDAKLVRDFIGSSPKEGHDLKLDYIHILLPFLLKGFAREGNEIDLLQTVKSMKAFGMDYTPDVQKVVVEYYLEQNNLEAAKEWYAKPLDNDAQPSKALLRLIIQYCSKTNELDWCKSVFKGVINNSPSKQTWDVILEWAASIMGKGVEEIERMMAVMARASPESICPDTDTINGLVSTAVAKNNPYLAERYTALGNKYGIQPNALTYILQIDSRLLAGDIQGVHTMYEKLLSEEVHDNADLPVINRYIQALCAQNDPDLERLNSITSNLDLRKVRLEAPTVASLCMVYFAKDENDMAVDTLNAHTFYYTPDERTSVYEPLLEFVFSEHTDVTRGWLAYIVIVGVFADMTVAKRTQVMNHFFQRRRGDMGTHVFGHMRSHPAPNYRPQLATYVDCINGIARCQDRESLDIVHNMMKLDSTIEPNTALYNALMHAYTQCDYSDKAVRFWDYITNSREGPDYRSLELVFRASQTKPQGDKLAKEVWDQIRRLEIDITQEVYAAYAAALSGQGKMEDAKALVETSEAEFGLKPDWKVVGYMYNAAPDFIRKQNLIPWIKEVYPEVWDELYEKYGMLELRQGTFFKLPGAILKNEEWVDDEVEEEAIYY